jgi:predicted O-linked N-acetylglucosamine transferase (SPINDLY family)
MKIVDVEKLKEKYKIEGLKALKENKINEAIVILNKWHYCYATYRNEDKYTYDYEILNAIKSIVNPITVHSCNSHKIRLGFLLFGANHQNSVLIKINLFIAKYLDRNKFDIFVFSPEFSFTNDTLSGYRKKFESLGVKFIFMPFFYFFNKNRLELFSKNIHKYNLDVLITSAALARFEHYFITLHRPARTIVGLLQGPPAQYVGPGIDHVISWSKHPLMDSPIKGNLIKMGFDLPVRENIELVYSRIDLEIPLNATVLISLGRIQKFQDKRYWTSILRAIDSGDNIFLLIVGFEKSAFVFPAMKIFKRNEHKIKFFGWTDKPHSFMVLADILVDTFPSGGGHVLVDAMALKLPIISFKNDYSHKFTQMDWSVAEEFVSIPDLIIERFNFVEFQKTLLRLIQDLKFRKKMAKKCFNKVHNENPTPENFVRSFENEIIQIINK